MSVESSQSVPGMSPALEVTGVTKTFDSLVALDGVDFALAPGEIHALLGENGAGKSTLGNVLAGIYRADEGRTYVDGSELHVRSPTDAIAAGIGMVHQHFRLVDALTVAENLHLGWSRTPRFATRRSLAARTLEICEEFGLGVPPEVPVWQLSAGARQRLEILRVLARGANVIILDEPTSVLTPQEAKELFQALEELRDAGRSVIFVSHKLAEVLEISDRITVLRRGRVVARLEAATTNELELARLMTGSEPHERVRRSGEPGHAPVLALQGVSARGRHGVLGLTGVELEVHEREIVGVAGVSGNGQSELEGVVTGLVTPESGRVLVDGADLTGAPPRSFLNAGTGHIPNDRLGTALVRSRRVLDSAVLRDYRTPELSRRGVRRGRSVRAFAQSLVAEADVRGMSSLDAPVAFLSGGNQQKLVAHREARIASRLLVAALPTQGLDVAAAETIRRLILEKREAGAAVLLISEDLDEVLELSDRIVVLFSGRIVGEISGSDADRESIGRLMGGSRDAAGASE